MSRHGYITMFFVIIGLCFLVPEPEPRWRMFVSGIGAVLLGLISGLVVTWLEK